MFPSHAGMSSIAAAAAADGAQDQLAVNGVVRDEDVRVVHALEGAKVGEPEQRRHESVYVEPKTNS